MISRNRKLPAPQRGFATILIVLLVGLTIGVSALGTAYYINTSQRTLVSSHALTNAQSGAWTGVEVFRKYLLTRSESDLTILNGQSLSLNIQGGRELSVNSITTSKVSTNPNIYRVIANVQNKSDSSEASSTIQVVYDVSPNSNSSSIPEEANGNSTLAGAMNFYGGLTTTGDINLANAGQKAIINVEGNVNNTTSGKGVSLTGVKRLNATGSVELGSSTVVDEVYSNKFIIISGGASVSKMASALQYIRMSSGGHSNGDFLAGNSNKIAKNEINKNDVYVNIENSSRVNSINTVNNVTIINGGSNIGTLVAGGNVECPKPSWDKYNSMKALSFDSSCSTKNRSDLNGVSPLNAIEVTEISAEAKPIVNAFAYINQANYILSVDENKKIKVKVQNIKSKDGKTDYSGDYYLAKIRTGSAGYSGYTGQIREGYLCKELQQNDKDFCKYDKKETTANWNTTVEFTPYYSLKFIHPDADTNSGWKWVEYNEGSNEWTLSNSSNSSPSIAPGVLFFNGNLKVANGNYINSLLASGDIEFGQNTELHAPNYSSENLVCNSVFGMPSNLCSTFTTFVPAGIANIALLAGSCSDDNSVSSCQSNYKGGTVSLGRSSKIYGNIIAGNILNTSGSTNIYGTILAAALGVAGSGSKLQESTTIDLNGLDDSKTTITLPSKNEESTDGAGEGNYVKIKWARYI
jgi:hypothetical protein